MLRRSTSVADAFILSVLDAQGRCQHLQIDVSKEGFQVCGTAIQGASVDDVLQALRGRQLTLVSGARLPCLTFCLLDDPKFQELVKHTSSSSASRTATMNSASTSNPASKPASKAGSLHHHHHNNSSSSSSNNNNNSSSNNSDNSKSSGAKSSS